VAGWLKNAFAVDPPGPAQPSEAEQQIVDRLAHEIVRRGLATPALMLLECSHPFNFIASQFLLFIRPFALIIFNKASYDVLVRFLDRRGSIETICRRIEHCLEPAPGGTPEGEPPPS